MSSVTPERFLFVVTVNLAELKQQERLTALWNQIDSERNTGFPSFIAEVEQRFREDSENVGFVQVQPHLRTIDWYQHLFAIVLEMSNLLATPTEGISGVDQVDVSHALAQGLVRAIFQPLNEDGDGSFNYLTWVMMRLKDLCGTPSAPIVLIDRKGIGGEKQ